MLFWIITCCLHLQSKDGGSMAFQINGILPHHNTVSKCRRLKPKFSSSLIYQVLQQRNPCILTRWVWIVDGFLSDDLSYSNSHEMWPNESQNSSLTEQHTQFTIQNVCLLQHKTTEGLTSYLILRTFFATRWVVPPTNFEENNAPIYSILFIKSSCTTN